MAVVMPVETPCSPPGWSVLSIDVEQGCLGLARDGEPQDLICLS